MPENQNIWNADWQPYDDDDAFSGNWEPTAQAGTENPWEAEWQEEVEEAPTFGGRVKESWETGKKHVSIGQIGLKQILGDKSPETEARAQAIEETIPSGPGPSRSLPEQAFRAAAEMAPIPLTGMEQGLRRGTALGLGFGAIATLGGPAAPITVPAAAIAGFSIGMISASLENIGGIEAGLAYREFKDLKDPDTGEKMSEGVAKIAGLGVGIINGAIELLQIKTFLRSIPGAESLVRKGLTASVKKVLQSKALKSIVFRAAKKYGTGVAIETGQEELQEIVNISGRYMATEVNNALKGTNIPTQTRKEIVDQLWETGKQSALAFSVFMAPGTAVSSTQDMAERRKESGPGEADLLKTETKTQKQEADLREAYNTGKINSGNLREMQSQLPKKHPTYKVIESLLKESEATTPETDMMTGDVIALEPEDFIPEGAIPEAQIFEEAPPQEELLTPQEAVPGAFQPLAGIPAEESAQVFEQDREARIAAQVEKQRIEDEQTAQAEQVRQSAASKEPLKEQLKAKEETSEIEGMEYKVPYITGLLEQVKGAEAGSRIKVQDYDGTEKWFGVPSEFPSFMKNRYSKKEVVSAIEKGLSGYAFSEHEVKQASIWEDVKSEAYEMRNRDLRAAAEMYIEEPATIEGLDDKSYKLLITELQHEGYSTREIEEIAARHRKTIEGDVIASIGNEYGFSKEEIEQILSDPLEAVSDLDSAWKEATGTKPVAAYLTPVTEAEGYAQEKERRLARSERKREKPGGAVLEREAGQPEVETNRILQISPFNKEKQENEKLTLDTPFGKITGNSAERYAKFLSYLRSAPALFKEGYSSLDIPTRLDVLSGMLGALQNDKVFKFIIPFIPVDVMNDLIGQELAPEALLHNKSMFIRALTRNDLPDIVAPIVDSIIGSPAFSTTKIILTDTLTGRAREVFPAIRTGKEITGKVTGMLPAKGRPGLREAGEGVVFPDTRTGAELPLSPTRRSAEKGPTDDAIFIDSHKTPLIKQEPTTEYKEVQELSSPEIEQKGQLIAKLINGNLFPGHKVKYDGIWPAFAPDMPDMYQFTAYAGPAKGATFIAKELEADAVKDKLEDTVDKFSKAPPVKEFKEAVDKAAEEADTTPTDAQIEAGNYRHGHINIQGLDISIENPKGSFREGVSPEGKKWRIKLKHHYGYFKRTEARDGDQVDVFIGDDISSDKVFVINQINPGTKNFDEHKTMMGFETVEKARVGYLANYEPGWKGLGNIVSISVDEFKTWLKTGDTTKPISSIESKKYAEVERETKEPTEKPVKEAPESLKEVFESPSATQSEVILEKSKLKKQVIEGVKSGKFTGAVRFGTVVELKAAIKKGKLPVSKEYGAVHAQPIMGKDDDTFAAYGAYDKHNMAYVIPTEHLQEKIDAHTKEVLVNPDTPLNALTFLIDGHEKAYSYDAMLDALGKKEAPKVEAAAKEPLILTPEKGTEWERQAELEREGAVERPAKDKKVKAAFGEKGITGAGIAGRQQGLFGYTEGETTDMFAEAEEKAKKAEAKVFVETLDQVRADAKKGKKAGIEYVAQMEVAETGDIVEVTTDAGNALHEADNRLENYNKLLECIESD